MWTNKPNSARGCKIEETNAVRGAGVGGHHHSPVPCHDPAEEAALRHRPISRRIGKISLRSLALRSRGRIGYPDGY